MLRWPDAEERKFGLFADVGSYTYCILCRKWADGMHIRAAAHRRNMSWYADLAVVDRYTEMQSMRDRAEQAVNGNLPVEERQLLDYNRGGMQRNTVEGLDNCEAGAAE